MLIAAGCNSGISECDAVRIARGQLPASYGDADAIIHLDKNVGINGAWRVTFPMVDIPFSELGWEGDPSQYFKPSEYQRELPEGIYGNVTIYVDAETGAVTGRELDNGFILGGPGMYSECK